MGVKLAPPSRLRSAVALSPTAHTTAPFAATELREFVVPTGTGVQLDPPFVLRARKPLVPAIQPMWESRNCTALICSLVPLACALQVCPASVERNSVPALPTATRLSPPREVIAVRLGAPLITDSVHPPPLSVLRQTSSLSPTTTIVNPRSISHRTDSAASVNLLQ